MTTIIDNSTETFVQALDRCGVPEVAKAPAYALIGGIHQIVPDVCHTYRLDNGHVIGTVGNDYKVHNLRDAEIVDFAQPIIDTLCAKVDKVRQWDGKVSISLVLPKEFQINLKREIANGNVAKGDVVGCRASIVTSFDGSLKTALVADLMRLACLNGMTVSDRDFSRMYCAKHTRNSYSKFELASQAAESIKAYFKTAGFKFQKLVDARFTDAMMQEALAKIFAKGEAQEKIATRTVNTMANVMSRFQMFPEQDYRGTAWAAFNAVTEYLTHDISVRDTRELPESESREISNFVGGRADTLRQQAWEVINSLVV